jgi:FimV-like protein
MSNIALLIKQSVFRMAIVTSLWLVFSIWNIVYSSPYTLSSQTTNINPQSLQTADNDQGQWSNVSNLISGGGFVQNENDQTSSKSDKEQTTSASQTAAQHGKTNVSFVSEAQFLQLQQLVIQLNKTVMQLQQQINSNVSALKQESFALSERVQNLEVVARLLSVEIQALKKTQPQHLSQGPNPSPSSNTESLAWFKTTYQKVYTFFAMQTMRFWIIVSILVVLVLLILGFFSRPHSKTSNQQSADKNNHELKTQPDEEGEYDYMSSRDAIPAKFDLANAYIQMGNKKEATHVLEDILKIGTEEEKQKAQALLQKIQKQE